eukprot:Skav222353  [mRNA]  locus=scaffold3497:191883:194262:+ [translate_table: standard]
MVPRLQAPKTLVPQGDAAKHGICRALRLQHTYFPGLGIKNGLCIVLQPFCFPFLSLKGKESFKRIKREIAEYITRLALLNASVKGK